MKKEEFSSSCVAWIAIGVSIACFITMLVRVEPFEGLDLFNTCIAFLTLVITAYVGLQIYQALTLKKSIKKMNEDFKEEMKSETKEIIENRITDYDHEISGSLYQILGIEQFNRTQYDKALSYFILGIKEQNLSTKSTYTDGIISFIERYPIDNIYVSLTKKEQDLVVQTLADSKHEKATELIRYFLSLPLSDLPDATNQDSSMSDR